MIRLSVLLGALALGACTSLHEPLEEAKPIETVRLAGDFEHVGHCLERGLHERDPNGHYAFHGEGAEGTLEVDGEWEVILRQETPTSFRAAIKTKLTNTGAPKRPAGLSLMIAQCAGER